MTTNESADDINDILNHMNKNKGKKRKGKMNNSNLINKINFDDLINPNNSGGIEIFQNDELNNSNISNQYQNNYHNESYYQNSADDSYIHQQNNDDSYLYQQDNNDSYIHQQNSDDSYLYQQDNNDSYIHQQNSDDSYLYQQNNDDSSLYQQDNNDSYLYQKQNFDSYIDQQRSELYEHSDGEAKNHKYYNNASDSYDESNLYQQSNNEYVQNSNNNISDSFLYEESNNKKTTKPSKNITNNKKSYDNKKRSNKNHIINNYMNYDSDEMEFTVEEIFEEMVCKLSDYFQESIDSMIDGFCYDLLFILDNWEFLEDFIDYFSNEIADEVHDLIQEEFNNISFAVENPEDIIQPFEDSFFEAFLNAHDYSETPITTFPNLLRAIRSNVADTTRETKKKYDKYHSDLFLLISEIESIRNYNKTIESNSKIIKVNQKYLQDLEYQYKYRLEYIEKESKFISKQSNLLNSLSKAHTDINETTNTNNLNPDLQNNENAEDDLEMDFNILTSKIKKIISDQNSKRKEFFQKRAELLKHLDNFNESRNYSIFLCDSFRANFELLENLKSTSDVQANSMNESSNSKSQPVNNSKAKVSFPYEAQLRSFTESSENMLLNFRLKSKAKRMKNELNLEKSQLFMESVRADNDFFDSLLEIKC